MNRRLPVLPTLLVLIAVGIMIALGLWQLERRGEKEAALAVLRANPGRPAVMFPRFAPVPPDVLFRPSSLHCLRVVGWRKEAGRSADGTSGFRHIAECATGAEGPGALVNVGVSDRSDAKPTWSGGQVSGWIAEEPDHRSFLASLSSDAPPRRPMLIARAPAPGLRAAAPPRADDVPNNHLAYAVQWFLFAGVALVIYVLAVRRRWRDAGTGDRPG